MRAALAGDQSAYRLLLTNLRPWLVAYFGKRIHQNVVEDLVQETLTSLHAKRQTFDPNYPFGPWIAAVARHRLIDHYRTIQKYAEAPIDEDFPAVEQNEQVFAKYDVKALLDCLPANQAKVVEMVKLQEMSVKEVSHKTGYSPSNVKILVHRGIKKMMAVLKVSEDERPTY